MRNFDFDGWAELARTDPNKFELNRRETVNALIQKSDNIPRLQSVQTRIDEYRSHQKDLHMTIEYLTQQMWTSVFEMNRWFHLASTLMLGSTDRTPDSAKIIFMNHHRRNPSSILERQG